MLHVCICGLLFRPHANYRKKLLTAEITSGTLVGLASSTGSMIFTDDLMEQEVPVVDCADSNMAGVKGSKKDFKDFKNADEIRNAQGIQTSNILKNDNDIGYMEKQHELHVGNFAGERIYAEQTLLQAPSGKHHLGSSNYLKESNYKEDSHPASSPKSRRGSFDWSLLTNPVMFLYILFALFVNVGYPNVFFMVPVHAENVSLCLLSFLI